MSNYIDDRITEYGSGVVINSCIGIITLVLAVVSFIIGALTKKAEDAKKQVRFPHKAWIIAGGVNAVISGVIIIGLGVFIVYDIIKKRRKVA